MRIEFDDGDEADRLILIQALKDYSDGLYSGDPGGRLRKARADYMRGLLEDFGPIEPPAAAEVATSPA